MLYLPMAEALVLRATSQRVGVTANAAYRHFADRDDLLRGVARRCLDSNVDPMGSRARSMVTTDYGGPERGGSLWSLCMHKARQIDQSDARPITPPTFCST